MDVVGSTGIIAARQALALQAAENRIGNAGRQAGGADFSRSLQDNGVDAASGSSDNQTVARTAERAMRVIAASDIQNPNRPLPRGSLVNILV